MWLLSARSKRFVLGRIILLRNTREERNRVGNITIKQRKSLYLPYTGRKRRSAISAWAFTEPIYEVLQQRILN